MAKAANNEPEPVDYIACDVPDDMTLEQFRRGLGTEQRRFQRLRELGARWLHRTPRS